MTVLRHWMLMDKIYQHFLSTTFMMQLRTTCLLHLFQLFVNRCWLWLKWEFNSFTNWTLFLTLILNSTILNHTFGCSSTRPCFQRRSSDDHHILNLFATLIRHESKITGTHLDFQNHFSWHTFVTWLTRFLLDHVLIFDVHHLPWIFISF